MPSTKRSSTGTLGARRRGLALLTWPLLAVLDARLGGQAVLDGVMMRGPQGWAVAVRRPDNRIAVMLQAAPARAGRSAWARLPLVRGLVVAWESLSAGIRALAESAKVLAGEDQQPQRRSVARVALALTVVLAIAAAVALFFLLPLAATRMLVDDEGGRTFWLVEGGLRIVVLIAYVVLIGLIPDVRRMLQYHGAEHMAINAHEGGHSLEPAAVLEQPGRHPRCGTAFVLAVLIVAVAAFAIVGDRPTWQIVVSRVVGIPLIAALVYEIVRLVARAPRSLVGRLVGLPFALLQALTVRRPRPEQVEVACVALRRLLAVDHSIGDTNSRVEVLA